MVEFHNSTGIKGFSPKANLRQNIEALLLVMSNIKTYISNSQTIKNDFNVILTNREYEKLTSLVNLFNMLKYTSYHGEASPLNNITPITKKLNMSVLEIFKSAMSNDDVIIFNSFSCHDTELLAMASSMGLILDEGTDFTSYFLFELFVLENKYIVGVRYNDGLKNSIDEPKYWKNQKSDGYCYWSELPAGYFTFIEFENLLLSGLY
jgi:hypothetical protein